MKTVLYKASTRGHKNHGWLDTYHTFSFADYYDPQRIHFGTLRVLNDDVVKGGEGFGRHPHDNMEIISIPLKGALEHGDSMGNKGVIEAGDVQVMSAGTGVMHSEFNADEANPVNFFQIWVFPKKKNVEPRYQQMKLDFLQHKNELRQIVSPNPDDEGLWIHQDAWFSIGSFDKDAGQSYTVKQKGNGVFAMVIEGEFEVAGQKLSRRDGLGIFDTDTLTIKSDKSGSQILIMDIPMTINA